jgi:hypothetical protein
MRKPVCAVLLALALVSCSSNGVGSSTAPDREAGSPIGSTGTAAGAPRTTIQVRIAPASIGPVSLSVTRLHPAKQNDAHPWVTHKIVFENRGDRLVEFDDTRHSAFVPNDAKPVLLVADEGCGYGKASPSAPIEAGACATYLDLMTVAPGKTATRDVTIFKGLKGMSKLKPGTYSFAKKISFHSDGQRWSKTVRLIYTIS